jgi:endoglucanase
MVSNIIAHPFNFASMLNSLRGKTIWGSDADKAELESTFDLIRGNFTDVPLILGEYDASPTNTEPAARWKYHDQLIRSAAKYDISTIIWDNGLDHLDRTTSTWRDPTSISIINNPSAQNSLPDSTEDAAATSQWTSAYIFHKVGTDVTDQTLPFLFNGNTLTSITDSKGSTLKQGADYTVSGSDITFKAPFLSTYISASTTPGIIADLTLKFSAGASPIIQIVQWDTPSLSSTSAAASSVSGSDLSIPITWKGIPKPAAVKVLTKSGRFLFDDWTQWLGPLQQARSVSPC